jgi:RHS repeat-associated protein
VYGTFYPNPNNNGGFDFSQLSHPAFSQRFQLLYFNPYDAYQQAACTNSPGVNDVTRPFTEVTQSPDGTCGTVPAQGNGFQAGVGSLNTFEATFTSELTVAAAGQYTFYFRTDDGWIMGAGPKIGGTAQPTFVSGDLSSAPPATPQKGYPVVGAYNQPPLGTFRHTTVNFPAAGTYPIEVDYSECCGGGLVLMFVNGNFAPIGGVALPEQTYGSCRAGRYQTPTIVAKNQTGCLSDPVNTLTGAYMNTVDDVSLPGIGVPFSFTRSYTSADPSSGDLGISWTDNYASSLAVQANGDVVLRAGDGQQVRYTLQPDGSFVGAPGALATLTKLSDHYELLHRDQQVDRYDLQGRLLSERDRNGEGVTLAYDANGLLQTATDSAQRVISFTHAGGLLTKVSLPDGRSVSYGYTSGRLTSVTDLRGGITTYGYDGGGRLNAITDQDNHPIARITYGADGRVTQELDGLSNPTTFVWDPATQTATVTDARQNVWKDVYSNNVLVQRIDPLGNTTKYGYDSALNLSSITDARGNTTKMSYDGRGNLLSSTAPAPLSYNQSFQYDAQNNLKQVTDGRNNSTTFDYDAAGNLIKMTQPGSIITQYGRDPAGTGLLTSITDPRQKTATFGHDGAGDLISIVTPLGEKATFDYDGSGRMTSLVEPRGNVNGANPANFTWKYGYDNSDRLVSQTDPLGNVTQVAYDPAGSLSSRTEANTHKTSYDYDANNRLITVTASDGTSKTKYGYDSVGNLITRTDPKNHLTTYGYDAANRVTSVLTPLNEQWTYGYSASGDVTSVVDANGNGTPTTGDGTTTFGYDVLDRLTLIGYSDSTPAVGLGYDANGNRTSMTDGGGSESYTYDALNRLSQVTRGTDSFGYQYDPAGNVLKRTYPDASFADYTYDDDGRPATVTSVGATTGYGYDAAGDLTTTTLPSGNGYVETRTYDRAGRLTAVQNTKGASTLSSFTYTLDAVGDPTTITGSGGTTTYGYDNRDRLTSVCFKSKCPSPNDPFIRWTYDPVGNRLTEARPGSTTSYSYNADDELSAAGTTSYGYDANGNNTSAGSRSFAYDLANRLSSTTNAGVTTTYSYDGDGKRLKMVSGATTTNYLWDVDKDLPQLALERDGTGATIRRYLYGAARISMTSGGTPFYYHYDGLGSVANLTSATGVTQWSYTYEPFGTTRTATQGAGTTPPTNLMRFAGELVDSDTGLYHLRARQYDPVRGGFTASDPFPPLLTNPAVSTYLYADADPTLLVDPSGLCNPLGCVTNAIRAAGRFVSRHPVTVGACAGSSVVVVHVHLHGNACVTVSTRGGVGGTATGGAGLSTELFGGSATVGGEVSTARCTEDLRRWFGEGGLSAGEGLVGGGDVFVGPGQANQTVYGVSGNVGVGAGTGPVEAHAGPTYTIGGTFLGRGCPANSK